MFWIRYKERNTQGQIVDVEITLHPGPTEIEYPERRLYKTHTTQDGATIIQRPLRDNRTRQWVWKGYPPMIPTYENQWKVLEALEYRYRIEHDLPGYVEVWEDISGVGGFDRLDGSGNRIYTKVKFIQVNRTPRKGGGFITYDESSIEFVVEDTNYTAF